MKRLYFVRHGSCESNEANIWAAQGDTPLTVLGRQQAAASGKKAAAEGLKADIILVSPLIRARQTAEILATHVGNPPIEVMQELIERGVGELENTSYSAFFEQNRYEDIDRVPGAETIEQLQKRADAAWKQIKKRPEDTILIVSHSAFGRAFRRAVDGLPWQDEYAPGRKSLTYAEILQLV